MSIDIFDVANSTKSPNGDLFTKVKYLGNAETIVYFSNNKNISEVKALMITSFENLQQTGLMDKLFNVHTPYVMGILAALFDLEQRILFLFDEVYVKRNINFEEFNLLVNFLIEPKIYFNSARHCGGNNRDENGLPIDPIRMESIPVGEEIEIGNNCYFEQTVKDIVNSNKKEDPITREPIPQYYIDKYLIKVPKFFIYNGKEYPIKNDGELDLSQSDLVDLKQLIPCAPYIKKLSIDKRPIRDLSPLRNFNKLQYFSAKETNIDNIDIIVGMPELNELYIEDCPHLRDMSPILECRSLKSLGISGIRLDNLSFLRNCFSLTYLDISNCNLTNIDEIRNLHSLINLQVGGNNILSLDALTNKQFLQFLECSHTHIDNIDALRNVDSLKELDISTTNVSDLSPLVGKEALSILNISQTDVNSLEIVKELPSLENLSFANCNKIKDITPILSCHDIKNINMEGVRVDNYTDILEMSSIEYITDPEGNKLKGRNFNPPDFSIEEDEMNITNDGNHDYTAMRDLVSDDDDENRNSPVGFIRLNRHINMLRDDSDSSYSEDSEDTYNTEDNYNIYSRYNMEQDSDGNDDYRTPQRSNIDRVPSNESFDLHRQNIDEYPPLSPITYRSSQTETHIQQNSHSHMQPSLPLYPNDLDFLDEISDIDDLLDDDKWN